MRNEALKFSHNWNDAKLLCKFFTTIRLHNPRKYAPGQKFDLYLKGAFMGVVEVQDHKRLTLDTMTPWVAFLDTGYGLEETKKIIRTMYKKGDLNFTDQTALSYVLLKKIENP